MLINMLLFKYTAVGVAKKQAIYKEKNAFCLRKGTMIKSIVDGIEHDADEGQQKLIGARK